MGKFVTVNGLAEGQVESGATGNSNIGKDLHPVLGMIHIYRYEYESDSQNGDESTVIHIYRYESI